MKKSSVNAFRLYTKTRAPASSVSHARARALLAQDIALHDAVVSISGKEVLSYANILNDLKHFRPTETVFEISRKLGKTNTTEQNVMLERRRQTARQMTSYRKKAEKAADEAASLLGTRPPTEKTEKKEVDDATLASLFDVVGEEPEAPVAKKRSRPSEGEEGSQKKQKSFKDEEHYVAYRPADDNTEKGYNAVTHTMSLAEAAHRATLDLTNTMEVKQNTAPRWDPKKKKFIRPTVGRDNKALMRTESGLRVPASFKSGAYDKWRQQHGLAIPAAGEQEMSESDLARLGAKKGGARGQVRHHREDAKAPLDPLHINYERKKRQQDARQKKMATEDTDSKGKGKMGQRPVKSELKSREKIVKERREKEKRRAKTGRHHVAKLKSKKQKSLRR